MAFDTLRPTLRQDGGTRAILSLASYPIGGLRPRLTRRLAHTGLHFVVEECNLPATTHGHDIWECANCGSFMEQMIDNSAEWRNYSEDSKDNVRCSVVINRLLPQSSKGTIILQGPVTNNNM